MAHFSRADVNWLQRAKKEMNENQFFMDIHDVPADFGYLKRRIGLGADEGHHVVVAVHEELTTEGVTKKIFCRFIAHRPMYLRHDPHRRAVLQVLQKD